MGISVRDLASSLGDTLTRGVGGNIDYVARSGKPAKPDRKRGKPKQGGGEKALEGGGVLNFLGDVAKNVGQDVGVAALLGPALGPAVSSAMALAQGGKAAGVGGGGGGNQPSGGGGGNRGGGRGGGGGGRGGIKGSVDYFQRELGVSRQQARKMVDEFVAEQSIPQGMRDYAAQYKAAEVDPLAAQMFYSQTVAPYLQQQTQQLQNTAAAGQDYMANLINTTKMDPAYSKFLSASMPVVMNAQTQAGLAGQAAGVAAPAVDELFARLQQDINAKEQLRAYREQQDAIAQLGMTGAAGGGQTIDPKTGQIVSSNFGS